MPSPPPPDRPVVVLGAGIIGLTTAARLLEAEPKRPVHILADHWPSDPLSPRYASAIAGAHHLSFADDADVRQPFRVLYDEWKRVGETTGLMGLTQTELWVGSTTHLKIYEEHPDFQLLDPKDANCPADHMISFTSLTITPALYLAALEAKVRKLGAVCHRVHLAALADLSSPPLLGYTGAIPSAVFVCVGIGARFLLGVADPGVYPTRGQVVTVRAPWVRSGWTRQVGSLNGGEGGARTYIIPRCTGEVVLGGTREERDWTAYPRPESTRDILKRAVEVCPELVPPHARQPVGLEDAWRQDTGDASTGLEEIVLDTLVGFRPSRVGGARVERQDVRLGGGFVPLVHNYGHGGAGWQSCWGCAEDAVALLDKAKL